MHVWRERMGRWLRPIALRIPFSPNTISVVALLFIATAAWMISQGSHQPRFFLWALPLVFLGGLLDAMDGIVARVQNRQTRFGDFLDHCLDRVSDTLLTVGWALGTGVRIEILLASVLIVFFNGYVGTQLEATFGSRSYEGTGRGEFVLALFIFPTAAFVLSASGLLSTVMAGLTIPEWMTLVLTVFAVHGILQRFREAHRLGKASGA